MRSKSLHCTLAAVCFLVIFLSIALTRVAPGHRSEHDGPGESDALRSFDWWYDQRALPYALIPHGAFEKAARYVRSSMAKEQPRGTMGAPGSQWISMGPTNIGG